MHANLAVQTLTYLVWGHVEVVVGLESEPEPWRRPEISGEAQRCLSCHTAFTEDDLVDPPRLHTEAQSQPVLAELHGLKKLLKQHLPGMHGGKFFLDP
jgi:hypothetical protein